MSDADHIDLSQAYDPVSVEGRWYDFWMSGGYFEADETSDKEPYTIVIPPPNVTGSLHMGHALFVTLQDVLVRWKRMQGYEALWLPGTDHAGIATQVVVERLLREEGTDRHELGREAFLERVWQWKEESGGTIVRQLKRMGASCDWKRERFTMDEGLSHAVRTIFVRMFEDGLIYRGDRMVNWDPSTQTVLSNLEVLQNKDGEAGKFWFMRYPLADGSGHITIGTTRPETMLGDTAVAVHPDDERYTDMIGKMIELPLTGRQIPIIADTILPDPEKGTGAVKITPAHDPNDYECGERHGLERIQVIGLDATMMAETCPAEFAGMDRYEARKAIVAAFDALGLLERVDDITYSPGRSERTGVVVEPLVMKQWWVRGEPLAKPAIEAVESGATTITPSYWKATFDHFMHNIQDWCISRQLWWGHQVPAWYGPGGEVFVAMTEEDAKAQAEAKLGEGVELTQDPDVLDTWFSSGLWPFSTLGWPEQTESLEKFYPTQVMETGSDILFFWVARMMMMGIYAMGETPFADVYLHSMVRDEKGHKMSKVKGNVIDPLHLIYGERQVNLHPKMHKELIRKIDKDELLFKDRASGEEIAGISTQGADALRFTLSALSNSSGDIKLNINRMEGYRAFLNKLWNASKFVLDKVSDYTPPAYSAWSGEGEATWRVEDLGLADRWMLSGLTRVIGEVDAALEAFKFEDAAQAIYDFVWHEYCDWYIEASKARLYDDTDATPQERQASQGAALYALEVIVRLLHPISPFITEHIWQVIPKGEGAPTACIIAPWPRALDVSEWSDEVAAFDLARGIVSATRQIRGETNVKPGRRIERAFLITEDAELRATATRGASIISRLAKIDGLELLESAPEVGPTATAVVEGLELQIPLKGLIDVEEELARLTKEIARVDDDITHVSRKLNNEKFVSKAPDKIVAKEREKLAGFEKERAALQASLEAIEALR